MCFFSSNFLVLRAPLSYSYHSQRYQRNTETDCNAYRGSRNCKFHDESHVPRVYDCTQETTSNGADLRGNSIFI